MMTASTLIEAHVRLSTTTVTAIERLATTVEFLLGKGAGGVLEELVVRVEDGIRRRGSWGRNWLRHAPPLDALEAAEQPDPDAPWRSLVPEAP